MLELGTGATVIEARKIASTAAAISPGSSGTPYIAARKTSDVLWNRVCSRRARRFTPLLPLDSAAPRYRDQSSLSGTASILLSASGRMSRPL